MFSKPNKDTPTTPRRASPSIIGADCTITGNILSQGEVHVDGRVDGDVRCDSLVIGVTGVITGEISSELVRILGTVTGQIKSRAVEMTKTAHVVGDITHESLAIEAGAFIHGRFDHMQDPAEAATSTLADRNAAGQVLLASPAESKTKGEKKSADAAS